MSLCMQIRPLIIVYGEHNIAFLRRPKVQRAASEGPATNVDEGGTAFRACSAPPA